MSTGSDGGDWPVVDIDGVDAGDVFARFVLDLVLSEAEATCAVLLAEAGLPGDLTRAPTEVEIASRTSYAGIEAEVAAATAALLPLLGQLRESILALLAALLRAGSTVAELVTRLDLLVAGAQVLPGSAAALDLAETSLRRLLLALSRRAGNRVLADAAAAGLVAGAQPLQVGGDSDTVTGHVATLARRLAAETVAVTVRAVREQVHARARTLAGAVAAARASAADVFDAAADAVRAAGIASAQQRLDRATARAGGPRVTPAAPADAGGGDVAPSTPRAQEPTGQGAGAGVGGADDDDVRVAQAGRDAGLPSALTDAAHQAALGANGAGRTAGFTTYEQAVRDGAAEGARYYSSELLDRNTCTPCGDVDGTEYSTVDAALADYPLGQYVRCEGGARCRGTLVAVAATEAGPTLQTPFGR